MADEPEFVVGAITVRPSQSRIIANGVVTRIEPRMMQVLVVLTQTAGTTVARKELLDRCWGGLAVSDDALNRVVARLRQILETTGAGLVIETLPRIGYRLIGPAPISTTPTKIIKQPTNLAGDQLQELYHRALHGLEQTSREQLELAAGMLREVTERAPNAALGWAG